MIFRTSQVALTTELLRASRERLAHGPEAEAAARERFQAYVVGISSVQGCLATPFRAPCVPPPLLALPVPRSISPFDSQCSMLSPLAAAFAFDNDTLLSRALHYYLVTLYITNS